MQLKNTFNESGLGKVSHSLKNSIVQARGAPSLQLAEDILWAAWKSDTHNHGAALVLSMELSDLGLQTRAIELLHEFVQCNEVSKDVLQVAGKVALEIGAATAAIKLYQQVISFDPGDVASYELLISAYGKGEKYDDAIELLQNILPIFPQNAGLWLALGEILDQKNGNSSESKPFYDEAYKLAPKDYRVLTTYANALQSIDDQSTELYKAALKVKPDGHEAHLGLAIVEFYRGNLTAAWKHYEYRFSDERNADETAIYQVNAPKWKGESLKGKTLLVMAEQGIGDEVLFATNFPRLLHECEQLLIGCEPRLVSIFQRSFPEAIVRPFQDRVSQGKRFRSFPEIERHLSDADIQLNYACAFASSCAPFWTSVDNLPDHSNGYIAADPVLVEKFQTRCQPRKKGNLRVGISWESGKLSKGRKHSYPGLERLLPVLLLPDVDFFVLQYSYELDTLRDFIEENDVSLTVFEDEDLKNDIEANLAIMEHMDAVVGPPIATQSFAQALGKPTFMLCDGLPWSNFGVRSGQLPLHKNSKAFSKLSDAWAPATDAICYELSKLRDQKYGVSVASSLCDVLRVPENWVNELELSFRGECMQQPITPRIKASIDPYFSKLAGLKVGVCWHSDFNVKDVERIETDLTDLFAMLSNHQAHIICLHSDVTRDNASNYIKGLPEKCHFFEDFEMFEKYRCMKYVFDQVDLVVGPESFITLVALLHGAKTILLSDGPGWNVHSEKACVRIENQHSRMIDYRVACREKAVEEIEKYLMQAFIPL